jgi:hypothetical protein
MQNGVLTPEEEKALDVENGVGDTATITYRHNRISRFMINHAGHAFIFRDHLLTIPARLEDHFKEAYKHMLPQDRASIVRLKNVENETAVLGTQQSSDESKESGTQESEKAPASTGVRGQLSTSGILGLALNKPAVAPVKVQ